MSKFKTDLAFMFDHPCSELDYWQIATEEDGAIAKGQGYYLASEVIDQLAIVTAENKRLKTRLHDKAVDYLNMREDNIEQSQRIEDLEGAIDEVLYWYMELALEHDFVPPVDLMMTIGKLREVRKDE